MPEFDVRTYQGNGNDGLDLGRCSNAPGGDRHGRVTSRQNQAFPSDNTKQDVLITAPIGIELRVNANNSSGANGADKIFFTVGSVEGEPEAAEIIAVLYPDGNLYLKGGVHTNQSSSKLKYD